MLLNFYIDLMLNKIFGALHKVSSWFATSKHKATLNGFSYSYTVRTLPFGFVY